jgi:hypothetical protein
MNCGPSADQRELLSREIAREDLEVIDADPRQAPGGAGVEVGRDVIVEVHLDDDPVEAAD